MLALSAPLQQRIFGGKVDDPMPSVHYVAGEVGSGLAIVLSWLGTAFSYLPIVLSLFVTVLALTWYVILIYESKTFRDYLDRGKHRERALTAAENIKEAVERFEHSPPPPPGPGA